MKNKLIGDRAFYKRVLSLMIPIMIQTGITNFVNMLDNIMVGRLGTTQMTGVAVANQLVFVFNLCIFGAVSGAGIFGAQFFGKGDLENFKRTFRFKFLFCLTMAVIGILTFLIFGENLSLLYLRGEGNPADAAASLATSVSYLKIMVWGLIPYAIVQCYSASLRETGNAVPPMVTGLIAVFVNLILNYLLIFGNFGFPEMGIKGAALATVISRFVEIITIVFWTHKNHQKNTFIKGVYKSFYIPLSLVKNILAKGFPLMLNESLWAFGMAVLNQSYSTKGLDVVAANNICSTFLNVFNVAFMSVGMAIGVIVGQQLGAGKFETAKESAWRMIAFSVFVAVVVGMVYGVSGYFIPKMYNTTDAIRSMAFKLMLISAVCMPIDAFSHSSYFVLRSGGNVLITMIFDSGFVCLVNAPVAFVLCNYTSLSIYAIFLTINLIGIVRDILGFMMVKKGSWVRTL